VLGRDRSLGLPTADPGLRIGELGAEGEEVLLDLGEEGVQPRVLAMAADDTEAARPPSRGPPRTMSAEQGCARLRWR
jgi:hypothetical protein